MQFELRLDDFTLRKSKVSAVILSRHLYSATIAVMAFRALGVHPVKSLRRGSHPGWWVRSQLAGTLTARPPRLRSQLRIMMLSTGRLHEVRHFSKPTVECFVYPEGYQYAS